MIRLWLGPLRSGKTTRVRDAVRQHLRQREPFVWLTPTATMAEQVRHGLVREGFVVPRGAVRTLADFLGSAEAVITPGALRHFLAQALQRQKPAAFALLHDAPGLLDTLAKTQEELFNAGCDSLRLSGLIQMGVLRSEPWPACASLFQEVEETAKAQGVAFRASHVVSVAQKIRKLGYGAGEHFYLDGFFSFNLPERELLKALSGWLPVTVTLPEWPGAQATVEWLRRAGVQTERCRYVPPAPSIVKVAAPLVTPEAEEVARRILAAVEQGRNFGEQLVILRGAEPFVPLLRTVFARLGIPARFFFPGRLLDGPAATGQPEPEDVDVWRARAARNQSIRMVLDEAARFLDPPPATLAELQLRAPAFVSQAAVRLPNQGENSVAVVDAFEARQWERPLVYVCGMLEGTFPRHLTADPLLSPDIRDRLITAGIPVDSAFDRMRVEESLFQVVTSRATEQVTLSWHSFDSKGDPLLPTLALSLLPGDVVCSRPVEVIPGRQPAPLPPAVIRVPELRQHLAETHRNLHATSIDSFLQCPFQFFGRYSLGLRNARKDEDLLGPAKQGGLIHKVLEDWHRDPAQSLQAVFETRWAKFLLEDEIPDGYRAEMSRAQLLRSIRAIAAAEEFPAGWTLIAEHPFQVELERVRLRGRIDRLDIAPNRDVRVFEYKYTSEAGLKKRRDRHEEGTSVQGGLYLLAVEAEGYHPIELNLVGVRGEVTVLHWADPVELRGLMSQARTQVLNVAERIADGEIRPDPADLNLCRYCELRDACRAAGLRVPADEAAAAT